MNIKPIRNDLDHESALRKITKLWNSPFNTNDGDELDILITLVEKYEETRWPIDEPKWDPVGVLHYLIDEGGHTQAELAKLLGSRSRASEILSKRRALTVDMIHAITKAWKIPAELLVKPYKLVEMA
jgi:HTH-type transcriptional regulator/antitoxin HigA